MNRSRNHIPKAIKTRLKIVASIFRRNSVLLFHIGRSGSTVLADMLGQHSDIHWAKEIYEPVMSRIAEGDEAARAGKDIDAVRILKTRMRDAGHHIFGAEVKFFHLIKFDYPLQQFLADATELGIKKFAILERKNYFRKIVSSLVATERGKFHFGSSERPELTQIHIDPHCVDIDRGRKSLLDLLESYDRSFSELRWLLRDNNPLEFSYEQHIEGDPFVAYHAMCDYLGVASQQPEIRLRKTTPQPLRSVILNFDEIERYLEETKFGWMLNG
jgi:hypothetical protein